MKRPSTTILVVINTYLHAILDNKHRLPVVHIFRSHTYIRFPPPLVVTEPAFFDLTLHLLQLIHVNDPQLWVECRLYAFCSALFSLNIQCVSGQLVVYTAATNRFVGNLPWTTGPFSKPQSNLRRDAGLSISG